MTGKPVDQDVSAEIFGYEILPGERILLFGSQTLRISALCVKD
jgi:hypothetical protein